MSLVVHFKMCPRHDQLSGCSSEKTAMSSNTRCNASCLDDISYRFSKSDSSLLSEKCSPSGVYKRRKLNFSAEFDSPRPCLNDTIQTIVVTPKITDAQAAAIAENNDQDTPWELTRSEADRNSHGLECNSEQREVQDRTKIGSSSEENHRSEEFIVYARRKVDKVDIMNDSCSSSRSNTEVSRTGVDGACESPSCTARDESIVSCEISDKNVYISLLKKYGVLRQHQFEKNHNFEDLGLGRCIYGTQSCKVCSRKTSVLKMVICDNCEGAYHLSCCYLQEKELPIDEWLCHSCRLRKTNRLKDSDSKIPSKIMEGRRARNSGPITSMLSDKRPHSSNVRIGNTFQAVVPDWCGPVNDDFDLICEPPEMNSLNLTRSNGWKSYECVNRDSTSNWLQCQQVTDAPGGDGAICGKWRRAPHFEVQTSEWECFSAFLWDPAHADCAVSQELETEEVMKQLRSIGKVRTHPDGRQHKLLLSPDLAVTDSKYYSRAYQLLGRKKQPKYAYGRRSKA